MGFVLRVADSRGVQDEAPLLAVLGQRPVQDRLVVVRLVDGGRKIVELLLPVPLCGRTATPTAKCAWLWG